MNFNLGFHGSAIPTIFPAIRRFSSPRTEQIGCLRSEEHHSRLREFPAYSRPVFHTSAMSSLSDQLNAFKSKLRTAPAVQRRVVRPDAEAEKEKQRQRELERKKQQEKEDKKKLKVRLPIETNGNHLSTQLTLAVEEIKKHDEPITIQQIRDALAMPMSDSLIPLLREVDRIQYNPEKQTFRYLSLYNITSGEELLRFLRSQPTFKGIHVKELKDGWNGCVKTLKELEKKDEIIVLRTKKDNDPRLVWANRGGPLRKVEEDIVNAWHRVKLPEKSQLPMRLEEAGLKPTSADPASIKRKAKGAEQRKQKKPRRGKITNLHMRGILKDYSQR